MELHLATPNGATEIFLHTGTIDVQSYPLIDWSFFGIVLLFLTTLAYALHRLLDEAGARKQQDQARVEYSRLSRTVRNARRDFSSAT